MFQTCLPGVICQEWVTLFHTQHTFCFTSSLQPLGFGVQCGVATSGHATVVMETKNARKSYINPVPQCSAPYLDNHLIIFWVLQAKSRSSALSVPGFITYRGIQDVERSCYLYFLLSALQEVWIHMQTRCGWVINQKWAVSVFDLLLHIHKWLGPNNQWPILSNLLRSEQPYTIYCCICSYQNNTI